MHTITESTESNVEHWSVVAAPPWDQDASYGVCGPHPADFEPRYFVARFSSEDEAQKECARLNSTL